ncbi:hypothetical protein CPTAKMNP4_058 [Salmonella phage vB_SenM-AKM_NP4]|nr:hypothetical protein I133_gp213 [Salmonella phage vB_SenM-S16]UFK27181.1 hypothetical protein LG358_00160 [Escherichia phage UoN_LG358_1]UPW42429.1 hypothetical protein EBPHNEJP_00131 [Salmonella phage CF-SP2]WKV23405.1 hypothetical protein SEA1_gp0057 [Salmonella phage SEA1]WLI71683.1 hypothetical protein CPTAKMNP4_058 [Salmonella phage vB_SenM-AKM_NP4]AEO97041.1 hypothetical protein [Salmonella phage vB_SenM-S16]
MRLKIDLAGMLEDIPELEAIPYILKMYLREVLEMDIHIDPTNPHDITFIVDGKEVPHQYVVSPDGFYFSLDYFPK